MPGIIKAIEMNKEEKENKHNFLTMHTPNIIYVDNAKHDESSGVEIIP